MCEQTADAETTLTLNGTAPGEARRFLRQAHCNVHASSVIDDALLLVSELVTNAVVHGSPPIVLRIRCDETTGMQVAVRDSGTRLPEARVADEEDERGRGVFLVDYISDDWGVESGEGGKEIWFRLRTAA